MKITPIASGSSGNCYFVTDGRTRLLLDCGISADRIKRALWRMGERMASLDGCFISHAHGDHVKAAQKLADMGVDVFTSAGTVGAAGLMGHNIHKLEKSEDGRYRGVLIPRKRCAVTPFPVVHDAPEPVGFVVSLDNYERLAYITDTPFLEYSLPGITHLMIEANYDGGILAANAEAGLINEARAKRTASNHMSIDSALSAISRLDRTHLKQVWLLHLSNDNAGADFKRRVQEATGAEVYIA